MREALERLIAALPGSRPPKFPGIFEWPPRRSRAFVKVRGAFRKWGGPRPKSASSMSTAQRKVFDRAVADKPPFRVPTG
jgi:hypothetical protein